MLMQPSKSAKKFGNLARRTARHPTADNVHNLRVLTRRLRADLWLVPKSQRNKNLRKTRKELSRLTEVLGEQRMYDVALADAIRYRQDTAKIKSNLSGARGKVQRVLPSRKIKVVSSHIEKAVRDLNRISAASFVPRIEKISHHLERAARHPPRSNKARHRLRLEVKKARYVLDTLNGKVRGLNELQDHLGQWHDLIVLSHLIGRSPKLITARNNQWIRVERSLPGTVREARQAMQTLVNKLSSKPD